MTQPEWIEIALFIHGITPGKHARSHDVAYGRLFGLIQDALKESGKPPLDSLPIQVEWGWESGQSAENDRFLAEAESVICEQVNAAEQSAHDPSVVPLLRPLHLRARQMLISGLADLFYYVSKDGERVVRKHVFNYLCSQINERKASHPASKISLTLIAHSAGALIAHDLLYHLFRKTSRKSEGGSPVSQVRELARKGELRVRRFYSMGTPLTPLAVRADSLLVKIAKHQQKADPECIGLKQSDGLSNPRWVNFWDMDDVAAFPVEFLYANENKVIEDKYVDLGGVFPAVHARYWTSAQVAGYIAETF